MNEIELLRLQLEKCYPEDKSLSPKDMSDLMAEFCKKRGLTCKFEYLRQNELTQELISRINVFYTKKLVDLRKKTGSKSSKIISNYYYAMVYVILEHHKFGITKKNNKIGKLSKERFAKYFKVDRKTISRNLDLVNFYSNKRQKWKPELKYIFDEIEKEIIRK